MGFFQQAIKNRRWFAEGGFELWRVKLLYLLKVEHPFLPY